jgi:hypothetical protein
MNNEQRNPQQIVNQNARLPASQSRIDTDRSHGFYNGPSFQLPSFAGEKPTGWFGTNRNNWISNHDSELLKNRLASAKNVPSNK